MIGRNWTAYLLGIALGFALLIRLFPTFNHMSSMQTASVSALGTDQSYVIQGVAGHNSSGPCCDAMGAFSSVCDFMAAPSACVTLFGDSERAVISAPVVQSVYIEAVIPPPKA